MTTGETSGDASPQFVLGKDHTGFTVRRVEAPEMEDRFVSVDIYENEDCGHPFSRITARGVLEYTDFERYGHSSISHFGFTKIEVETGILDDPTKARVAEALAALTFDLAEIRSRD